MTGLLRWFAVVVWAGALIPIAKLKAGDWPMWRHDAQRSAATPDELPSKMKLLWTRELPPLTPAWSDQPKLRFDAAYEPIVWKQWLIVGSSFDGSVTGYHTTTGREVWRFFTDGPVRLAPVAWNGKLFVASDDGYLYCLRADDGVQVWRFRGGPSDRKILGNERLISTWPARGAPVVADGNVYFAAGIWPFMGIFLHALDANTGDVLWTNDGDGSQFIKQPHNSDSFAGVAPQGPLVAIGSKLLVPGGRSVPACYDRETGKMLYYQLAENAKRGGGSSVSAVDQLLFNGGATFDLATGKYLGSVGELHTFADGRLFDARDGTLRALDLATSTVKFVETVDRKGAQVKEARWSINETSKVETSRLTALIKAGSRLYVGSVGKVAAIALPLPRTGQANVVWEETVPGTPVSLIAADDKLFAVTLEGQIHCFGASASSNESHQPVRHVLPAKSLALDAEWSAAAKDILATTRADQGYALAWGAGEGDLVLELVRQSSLRWIVVESDAVRAAAFRAEIRRRGWGGDRVSVIVSEFDTLELPPYFASLIVAESLPSDVSSCAALLARSFRSLRPFGGVACWPMRSSELVALAERLEAVELPNVIWKSAGDHTLMIRAGALPGSANWTHEHGDAANTRVGKDLLVKAPLGLLWFGGASNDAILPRHGHGPQPQVVDGRLFIEGVDLLRAIDIYTGRLLWEAKLPGVGALYDNTAHQPGANATGTNFVAMPDGVYVAYRSQCLKLDPDSGQTIARYQLPTAAGSKTAPLWGYLNVSDEYLVGGADPLFDPLLLKTAGKPVVAEAATTMIKALKIDNDNYSSSQQLVVMDRSTGKVLWTANARSGFRHNGICLGGGRLYCIDRLSGAQESKRKRRGEAPPHPPRLVVFDLKSGRELWSTDRDVFGTWLSYSAEHDVLVESGRAAADTLSDEPPGMRAYRADKGLVLWDNKSFRGPAMLHHDTILMAGKACHLLTGAPRLREHPLSGERVEWTWSRNYGCNTPLASEHLLTFRSGAAGYFDFCNDGGTGNFGGFRSGCTNNLIVAGGLLTAPDYTRTCTCSYQNQTSLALVHLPEAEMWTSFGSQSPQGPIRRVGLNLGAPGDRKADDGTLWLDYPSVGGASPALDVSIQPSQPDWFRRHSSQIQGDGLAWVAASGAKGLTSLKLKLGTSQQQPRTYRVRLHFAEPDDVQSGERVFDVQLQGITVLSALDVAREADGRLRLLVKEFRGVEVGDDLTIQLVPHAATKNPAPILSGVEVHAEGW
jgi:outer membrane protein assembly factor BamB